MMEVVRARHSRMIEVGRVWRHRGLEESLERGSATVIAGRPAGWTSIGHGSAERGVGRVQVAELGERPGVARASD